MTKKRIFLSKYTAKVKANKQSESKLPSSKVLCLRRIYSALLRSVNNENEGK